MLQIPLKTLGGRELRQEADGQWSVQPLNDNTWVTDATPEEALVEAGIPVGAVWVELLLFKAASVPAASQEQVQGYPPTETCTFLLSSRVRPDSGQDVEHWWDNEGMNDFPYAYGDINRSMITLNDLLKHVMSRMGDPEDSEPEDNPAHAWLKHWRAYPDQSVYIDLEN